MARKSNTPSAKQMTNNTNATANEVSTNPTAPVANEVSKSATEQPKTQRVLESRSDWECIFAHTVALITTLAKGEALEDDCRDGFAFGKVALSPNSRPYAKSLLAGFASKKAGKVLADTCLAEQDKRNEIAVAILLKTRLGGKDEASCKATLAKVLTSKDAGPKQAKSLAEAVKATL